MSVAPISYSTRNWSRLSFLPVTVSSRKVFDTFESTSILLTTDSAIVDTSATVAGSLPEVLVTTNHSDDTAANLESLSVVAEPPSASILTELSSFTYIVLIPESISKYWPRRSVVCFAAVVDSVLFNPIDPSLKLAQRNTFGYEVNWAPSELRGTVP